MWKRNRISQIQLFYYNFSFVCVFRCVLLSKVLKLSDSIEGKSVSMQDPAGKPCELCFKSSHLATSHSLLDVLCVCFCSFRCENFHREEGSADLVGHGDGFCRDETLQRVRVSQPQHQGNMRLWGELQHLNGVRSRVLLQYASHSYSFPSLRQKTHLVE